MTHPATASQKDFAAILGCTPGYVTQIKQAGRLVMTEDGKSVRVAESLARMKATSDPANKGVSDRHAKARSAPLSTSATKPEQSKSASRQQDEVAALADWDGETDYHFWKARRERAGALREEMRLGEEAGDLLRRSDVAAVVSHAFVTLRTDLEALPETVAPSLAAESDENRVRILLSEEIEHALGNLSNHIGKIGTKV